MRRKDGGREEERKECPRSSAPQLLGFPSGAGRNFARPNKAASRSRGIARVRFFQPGIIAKVTPRLAATDYQQVIRFG